MVYGIAWLKYVLMGVELKVLIELWVEGTKGFIASLETKESITLDMNLTPGLVTGMFESSAGVNLWATLSPAEVPSCSIFNNIRNF